MDQHTVTYTPVDRQRPRSKQQNIAEELCFLRGPLSSNGRALEERCFLRCLCWRHIVSNSCSRAAYAALPMVTLNISFYTNEISRRKKNWSRVSDGRLTPGQTGRLTVGRKLTSTSTATWLWLLYGWRIWMKASYIKKEVIVKQRKLKSGQGPHRGPDTKKNWPTDRRSQYNLNLNMNLKRKSLLGRVQRRWVGG
jgi:hypothetical protein